jgi:hypothetical protein
MSVIKTPYEISLWDDRLTLIGLSGKEYSGFTTEEKILAQYYKEIKLCIIGADTMSSPFRAVTPSLKRKTNG